MLKLHVKHHGRITTITIQGEVVISTIRQAEEIWNREINRDITVLAISCAEMSLIDSTSIGAFVKLLKTCEQRNITFLFYNVASIIHEVFTTTKLDAYFTILSDKEFKDKYFNI